ncbi:hypothetical protein ACFWBN_08220 [Streptomyces sp. NPDC059989]|uniref:hypothetical protein n=1 Tax=Streptomyces sp. NPDC059989 TaxID=3347026 RepID=UPI00367B9B88
MLPGFPARTVVRWADIAELTFVDGQNYALHLRLRHGAELPGREWGVRPRTPHRVVIRLPPQFGTGKKRQREQTDSALRRFAPHLDAHLP